MSKYIDENGLAYLWNKIKALILTLTYNKTEIDSKIEAIEGGNESLEEITEAEIDEICTPF